MSAADRYVPHYTLEDYQQWEGDWELWNGIPVAMTPSPFGRHSKLLVNAATAIKNAIDATGCKATVLAEIDWIISEDTVVRPDVVVVCGSEPPQHVESAPAVVVEILSDSTRERDTEYKRLLYRNNGVKYYLLLDPDTNELTGLLLNEAGEFSEVDRDQSLMLEICEDCQLDIAIQPLFR